MANYPLQTSRNQKRLVMKRLVMKRLVMKKGGTI
jgi:hypothetical protein